MAEETNHTHDLELIESFLDGDLKGEAISDFEGRRAEDAQFSELVDQEMLLRKGIEYSALSEALDSIRQAELRDNKKQVNFSRRWLYIAASIAVVAITTIVILSRPQTPKQLFADNFKPYPNKYVNDPRSSETDLKIKAFRAYSNEKYDQAIIYFNQYISNSERAGQLDANLLMSDEERAVTMFFLGNAYLANKNFDAAIIAFKNYLNKYDDYSEEAHWYILLAYLGSGQKEEVTEYIDKNRNELGAFYERAIDLREKVKKIE